MCWGWQFCQFSGRHCVNKINHGQRCVRLRPSFVFPPCEPCTGTSIGTANSNKIYLAPIADSNGRPLERGKTYKLHVPKEIPVKQFWSLTLYDRRTWVFIKNPLDRAGLGSFNMDEEECRWKY